MEDKVTPDTIDILASEYGWSINYIQDLDMGEINDLIESINNRKSAEYRLLSYIIALAISGKTIDNVFKGQEQRVNKKEKEDVNQQNMLKLFQLLGASPKNIKEGIKKGKLKV